MTDHLENAASDPSTHTGGPKIAAVSQKQGWKVSVSLEFDLQPILTWRGTVYCGSPATAANKGIREARKQFKGKKPRSWALLLEKV